MLVAPRCGRGPAIGLASQTADKPLPLILASREWISRCRRIGNGAKVWSSSAASVASDPVGKCLKLSVPVTAHGVPAEACGIINVDLTAPTSDAQVGLVLDEIVEAVEPRIG